jgi:hypothetical protein
MVPKLRGDELRVIFFMAIRNAEDFLKRDNIGIDFAQHLHNARWTHTAIHSTALVDVVGHNPEGVWHVCCSSN